MEGGREGDGGKHNTSNQSRRFIMHSFICRALACAEMWAVGRHKTCKRSHHSDKQQLQENKNRQITRVRRIERLHREQTRRNSPFFPFCVYRLYLCFRDKSYNPMLCYTAHTSTPIRHGRITFPRSPPTRASPLAASFSCGPAPPPPAGRRAPPCAS